MGSLNKRETFVTSNNSSLFTADGLRTVTALIKTEGLVTPLAVILFAKLSLE